MMPSVAARWAAAAMLCVALPLRAEPADYVFAPYAEPGARYLQLAAGVLREREGGSEGGQALALGFSPSERWFTQLYAGFSRAPGEALRFDAWSWLNHWQIVPVGRGPWALGLLLELERPRDRSEGDVVTWGPTLQWDGPQVQLNLNLLLSKALHADEPAPATLSYQWQAKRLWRPGLEWGLQGFGELGPWRDWAPASGQTHLAGPALFATRRVGAERVLRLDAALLAGLSSGSPRAGLRARLQLQF